MSESAKSRRGKKAGELVVMETVKQIRQHELARFVGLRNQIELFADELDKLAATILERAQNGGEIESGTHIAEIDFRTNGGRYEEVLLVDRREVAERRRSAS